MTPEYLFVYGTLLKDTNNEMSEFLASHSECLVKGFFNGKLYQISWFPGAVLASNPNDKVYGMVFKLKNPHEVFKVLDDYEGIGEQYQEPQLYKREQVTVFLDDKTSLLAWVYLYNLSVSGFKQIVSGNFLS